MNAVRDVTDHRNETEESTMRTEASTTKADLRAELARTDAMALDLWNREGQAMEAVQNALDELSQGAHITNEAGDNVAVSVPIQNWREAVAHLRSVLPVEASDG